MKEIDSVQKKSADWEEVQTAQKREGTTKKAPAKRERRLKGNRDGDSASPASRGPRYRQTTHRDATRA